MRKILSVTTLIMLERTMHLAIILLLVQYRFQNHSSDGKHNAKVGTENCMFHGMFHGLRKRGIPF